MVFFDFVTVFVFFVTVFETFVTVFDFFVTVFAGFVTAFAFYWGLGFMKTVRPEPLAEWFNEVSSMRGAERSELPKRMPHRRRWSQFEW